MQIRWPFLSAKIGKIRKNLFFGLLKISCTVAQVPMWQARMGYIQRLRRFTSSHAACNRHCLIYRRLEYITVDHKFDYTSFIIELCSETPTIRKIEVLLDSHGFPFRSTTEIDIGFEFWRSNALGFATRISWYSEKATMNFRDWRGYLVAFEPVECLISISIVPD